MLDLRKFQYLTSKKLFSRFNGSMSLHLGSKLAPTFPELLLLSVFLQFIKHKLEYSNFKYTTFAYVGKHLTLRGSDFEGVGGI